MEAALPADTFMRVHRSYIVNLRRIAGYAKGRIFFSAGKVPMLSVKLKKTDDPLKLATQLVGVYAALRAQTAGT